MKPEDLVVGKTYYWNEEPLVYIGEHKDWFNNDYPKFRDKEGFQSCFPLWRLAEFTTEQLGEKTMPERKPEEISIKLKSSEIVQALSLLGYELKGYKVTHVCGGTDRSTFTLKLEEADEKTKTTD